MLIESMNPKGIRERKLLEGLRKSRDRLKLKKTKKVAAIVATTTAVQDVPMAAEQEDDMPVEEIKNDGSTENEKVNG